MFPVESSLLRPDSTFFYNAEVVVQKVASSSCRGQFMSSAESQHSARDPNSMTRTRMRQAVAEVTLWFA